MNDTTTTPPVDETVIEGAITEVKPDNALVVLDPTKYATELFKPYQDELAKAKRSAARTPYDVKTDAGMVAAKEFRKTFVQIRTRADKSKTEAKRPIDQAGKKILEIYNTLAAAAKVEEEKHDKAITAREAEIAAEEQRKRDEQRARTEAIEARVDLIRGYPATLAKADSAAIEKALAGLAEKQLLPADYDDYLEEALTAFNATVDRVREMLTEAQEREAAQRKADADAAELKRLQEAEAERLAEAERKQKEADALAAANLLAAQRAAGIAEKMAIITNAPMRAISATTAQEIADISEELMRMSFTEEVFGERLAEAIAAEAGMQKVLTTLHESAVAREQAAALAAVPAEVLASLEEAEKTTDENSMDAAQQSMEGKPFARFGSGGYSKQVELAPRADVIGIHAPADRVPAPPSGYTGVIEEVARPVEEPATPAPCALELAHGVGVMFHVSTAQALAWLIAADFAGVDLTAGE